MPEPVVQFHERDGLGYLTLNDPPKNELGPHFFAELHHLTHDVLPRASLRGLIMHGSGRHFSCGANVAELKGLLARDPREHEADAVLADNVASFRALEALPYPVVAAVSGSCLGAGLELALACRYRLAAARAVFGLPEVQFGLMPGCGGTIRLSRLLKPGRAIDLILSGRNLLADEAKEIGLVDAVVDRKDLLPAAETFIRRITGPSAT